MPTVSRAGTPPVAPNPQSATAEAQPPSEGNGGFKALLRAASGKPDAAPGGVANSPAKDRGAIVTSPRDSPAIASQAMNSADGVAGMRLSPRLGGTNKNVTPPDGKEVTPASGQIDGASPPVGADVMSPASTGPIAEPRPGAREKGRSEGPADQSGGFPDGQKVSGQTASGAATVVTTTSVPSMGVPPTAVPPTGATAAMRSADGSGGLLAGLVSNAPGTKAVPSDTVDPASGRPNRRGRASDFSPDGISSPITVMAGATGSRAGAVDSAGTQPGFPEPSNDGSSPPARDPALTTVLAFALAPEKIAGARELATERTVSFTGVEASIRPTDVGGSQPAMASARPAGDAGDQVAIHIARAQSNGAKTITIDLHPAELGRVEVRLAFQSDGLSVRMTVERQETFDAFSRDRGGLEQQLAQAGVELGGGGLDLRLGQQSDQPGYEPGGGGSRSFSAVPAASVVPAAVWAGSGLIDILA
jgi:hypothetical protein